jgi:hypothetical protein
LGGAFFVGGKKMTATSPFQNFSAADCGDQLAEKLRRLLQPFCFHGTECHGVINAELRGPENEVAASNIRHVIVSQYQGTAPIDVVIEVVGKWLEDGEHSVKTESVPTESGKPNSRCT